MNQPIQHPVLQVPSLIRPAFPAAKADPAVTQILPESTRYIAGPENDPMTNPVGEWPWMVSMGHVVSQKVLIE